jgi:ComF family protein
MRLLQYVLRFFLPWACAGCRGALTSLEDTGFCGSCWLSIPRIQGLVCRTCGIPLNDGRRFCFSCRQTSSTLVIRAAVEYHGVMRPAIHRYKYLGRKDLSRSLGALLRYAWSQYPEIRDVHGLVPVPLYRSQEETRGYNQAELLARVLSTETGIPLLPLLVRTRSTRSQVELNRRQRQENVRSAFALQPLAPEYIQYLRGKSFLLIDDVCTTASTLRECAAVLRRVETGPVKALVLARDL